MRLQTLTLSCIIVTCLLALACVPVLAANGDAVTVLYQTSFTNDPKWVTNNPSSDYWDPGTQMYHFAIEPSTGSYAYTPVKNYDREAFTFEYDVILNSVDEGTTFRLGFSGAEMDPDTGPNVLTEFTNAKNGQIMWLHLVTPSNKAMKVNSKSGDTVSSGTIAYTGPTAKYSLNTTYHVTVNYNRDQRVLSMKVNEKASGKEVWGYFIKTGEDLSGMNRIYLGSIGDYGMMNRYAAGYIDNVRLTVPATETPTPTIAVSASIPVSQGITTRPTAKPTTEQAVTPSMTTTQESPLAWLTAIAALGFAALCCSLLMKRRN